MDRLELNVHQPRLDEQGQVGAFVVQEQFESVHALRNKVWRRRNEGCVSGASSTDPVLAAPEFAGLLVTATALRKKDLMDLADQAEGERKTAAHPVETVVQGGHVIRDFLDVTQGHARSMVVLEQQQVGKRRLRSLYLGREHRLFANVGVDKKGKVGEHKSQAIQPPKSLVCLFQQALHVLQTHRGNWGQRWRNERDRKSTRLNSSHL